MSLDDAAKKMSKSSANPASYIALLDPPDLIRKKISRAVTDSGRDIKFDPEKKPEVSNLMEIYVQCSEMSMQEIEAKYASRGYGDFKKDLAEQIVGTLEPIQRRYNEIRKSGEIREIVRKGAKEAAEIAQPILQEAKRKMGFYPQS